MKLTGSIVLGSALAAILSTVNAAAVRGRPEGFGSKATGGGSGPTVTPKTNAELTNYLRQQGPLNIIVTKTFDFRGTEGRATVECEPAEPEDEGAEVDHGDVVRAEVEELLLAPTAEDPGVCEAGNAAADLDGAAA